MATKYITFNYFEPMLVQPEKAFEAELKENNDEKEFEGDIWNMKPFMDYLSIDNEGLDFSYTLGAEYADIEPGSSINNKNLHHVQFSKLRETNIPAKKRIGEIKKEINLKDDEYIGEFNSIMYDDSLNVLMIQSNHYGLSTKHIEHYLTELRFRFLEHNYYDTEPALVVKLNPVIDKRQVTDAMKADYYRKIRIRGADYMQDSDYADEEHLINDVVRTIRKVQGVNIDLQISIGRAERTASLDNDIIKKTLEVFNNSPDNRKPNIELTLLENEEAQIETINLIRPRLHERIPFTVEPRTTIGHEVIFQKMKEFYKSRRDRLSQIIVRS